MAFEKLIVRNKSGRAGLPASISLTSRGGARPAVIVTLTRELVEGAGLIAAGKYDALIGTGDDAGKIRIVGAEEGLLTPRVLKADSFLLDLGFVETIGREARAKRFTAARVIAAGVVEVDIPDFDSAGANPADPTDGRGDVPREPPQPSSPPAAARKPSGKVERINGVAIDMAEGRESIAFRGKSAEVTARQARLVYLLARPRPTPVAMSFLLNALWDGKPPGSAMTTLQQSAADLQKLLSPIGLDLRLVKGVGYQLKDL